jgi:parvulin-like peptidyl-prolyl isomerase
MTFMRLRFSWSAGLVALLLVAGCGSKVDSTAVAVVDGVPITGEQFRARYQKYLSSSSMKDNIQVRKQVLENMINERLIFADLGASGADRDKEYQRNMDVIKRQALADGYARRLTIDTMRITPAQMGEEFRRYNTKLTARYVYASTEEGARALRQRLLAGATFEQLARETFEDPGLANNGGSLGTFGWGEMEEPLEDVAYALKPGEISDPVRLSMGYAIIRVDHRVVVNPLASESDFAKVSGKLGDAIIKRNAPKVLREHVLTITGAMDPLFDEAGVEAVAAAWPAVIGTGEADVKPEVPRAVPDDLRGKRLVRLSGEWWTVETLVERLTQTKDRQKKRVHNASDLKDLLLGLAARDVIIQRAEAMHMEQDSIVAGQYETMAGEYRLRHWAGLVQDTVGKSGYPDTLLYRIYMENKLTFSDPPMVNVAEVLVRTEPEARRIAREAQRGTDFSTLARTHSIRLWAAKRGGELGYNTLAGFGVMGEKFFAARTGAVVGPERVDPYWGVFKVLGRKDGRVHSFGESRERVLEQARSMKQRDVFLAAMGKLRERATVQMFVETLANVVVHSENH